VERLVVTEGREIILPAGRNSAALSTKLLRISDRSPFPIFNMARGKLYASHVVGLVDGGDVSVEIIPKALGNSEDRDKEFLLNLLRFAGGIGKHRSAPGYVQALKGNPIEALIADGVSEIARNMNDGVPRRYAERKEESPTIRGRIDFSRLSTRLPSNMTLLPVCYAPLTAQNELAQLVKWTCSRLLTLTKSIRTREILGRLLSQLIDVDPKGFGESDIARMVLSPFEQGWARTLRLARLIAAGNTLDPTRAASQLSITLVFPLEYLFERVLRRIFKTMLHMSEINVTHHTDKIHLFHSEEGNEPVFRIRPDLLFKRRGEVIAIGDVKWKRLAPASPSYGLDVADLYQVSTYLDRYGARSAVLLFPRAEWMSESWYHSYLVPGTTTKVSAMAIDIESLVSADTKLRELACSRAAGILLKLVDVKASPFLGSTASTDSPRV
jgi:5-methylcytosine-specific restriction enzyme subunit McrC